MVAEIGPDGLDRKIWTKSGPSLDAVWTVFSKMVAEITKVCRVKVHKKRYLKRGELLIYYLTQLK